MKKLGKRMKRRAYDEAASMAVLAAAGVGGSYLLLDDAIIKSTREAMKHSRHATRTIGEVVVGTEGQRAVNNLIVQNESNRANYVAEMEVLDSMRKTYQDNETIGREAERLILHINGAAMQATSAVDGVANNASGGLFRKIDDFFMNYSVGDANVARAKLPEITNVYEAFREFYDGREKSEKTVEAFSDYLRQKGLSAARDNKAIENNLCGLEKQVGQTYETENNVFAIDDRVNFLKQALTLRRTEEPSEQEVREIKREIGDYNAGVDETRESIEQNTGIEPYKDPTAWMDYAINPLTIGLAAGVALKGVSLIPPGRKYISKALVAPIVYPLRGAKSLARFAGRKMREGVNYLSSEKSKNVEGVEK